VPGDGSVVQIDDGERGDAVDISGSSLQGEAVDLGELRGRVVVLNVWGSWCNPCRKEAPVLVEAAKQLGDKAAFVGLFARANSRADALAFEREYGISYPTVDDSGESLLKLGRYAPPSVPSTVVLDEEGRVAALFSGEVPSTTTLVNLVEDVAAEGD
jgi:thiol-disulfide isomerase/thioredoxin